MRISSWFDLKLFHMAYPVSAEWEYLQLRHSRLQHAHRSIFFFSERTKMKSTKGNQPRKKEILQRILEWAETSLKKGE